LAQDFSNRGSNSGAPDHMHSVYIIATSELLICFYFMTSTRNLTITRVELEQIDLTLTFGCLQYLLKFPPVNYSGARCVATLLNEMKRRGKDCRFGVISMCIGDFSLDLSPIQMQEKKNIKASRYTYN
jgi:hypothetical protein